jgi:hypothetical protein
MKRVIILALASAALALHGAAADIIRRADLPVALTGTWAENLDQCASKDKSNVVIEPVKYGDGSGSCAVRWVVQTAGVKGTNFAVHALCTSAADQSKTQIVNIIIQAQGSDRAVMGRSFKDLKTYQRCPAG